MTIDKITLGIIATSIALGSLVGLGIHQLGESYVQFKSGRAYAQREITKKEHQKMQTMQYEVERARAMNCFPSGDSEYERVMSMVHDCDPLFIRYKDGTPFLITSDNFEEMY